MFGRRHEIGGRSTLAKYRKAIHTSMIRPWVGERMVRKWRYGSWRKGKEGRMKTNDN
jgi:hypothetical protein